MNKALAVAVCYATSGRNIHLVRKAPDGWSYDGPETQLVQCIGFGHELENKTKQWPPENSLWFEGRQRRGRRLWAGGCDDRQRGVNSTTETRWEMKVSQKSAVPVRPHHVLITRIYPSKQFIH